MARIFNIYFNYDGSSYNAIVSVRKTPFFTEYTLNDFDLDIINMLPSNKIISNSPGHFVFHHSSDAYSESLMKIIINAVAEHIQMINI